MKTPNRNPNEPKTIAELLSRLCLSESAEFAKRYSERFGEPDLKKPNLKNSKAFVIFSLLHELQKLGGSLNRFALATKAIELRENGDVDSHDLFWDSLVDEFSLWRRKLSEGLVLLINFSRTNTSDYYYHFLLLKKSELTAGRWCEKKTFFGIENNHDRIRSQRLRRRLRKVEEEFTDLSRCWYRQVFENRQPKTINHKDALKLALDIAEPDERNCLAYTYARGYSELSFGLHLSFLRTAL